MSTAISVYHGPYGRASLYHLDRPMTQHAHREGHLIFYLNGCDGFVTVRGQETVCTADRAVLVDPWDVHSFAPTTASGMITLVLYINPAWFEGFAPVAVGEHARSSKQLKFGHHAIDLNEVAKTLIGAITHRLRVASNDAELDALLHQLTAECRRLSMRAVTAPHRVPPMRDVTFSDFRIRKALKIMADQLGATQDVDALARESGLSRPHFFKLFRRQTGLTPHVYLNTLRMEAAVEAIATSDQSITDIGLDLGFSSQSSFTRFFCSNVGMAPSDYRSVTRLV